MGTSHVGTEVMIDHRRIVTIAGPHLHQEELASRGSSSVSRQVMEDLVVICGAIADAIHRDLSPDEVVEDQTVRGSIIRHAYLVRRNGLPTFLLIDQYAVLRQAMLLSLESQSKQVKVSGSEAFALARKLSALFDRVTRLAIETYRRDRPS